ncbi:unnamed protein product [Caenorhabditis angaria]|uniref:C2H2-type domain-containing protein n=1 Tax=Caenorhabditis angaria TaxID=860376 RepID=A0A9P1I6B1_9PELO|nr:unnamed protein product [Caenorhabditis angaria]
MDVDQQIFKLDGSDLEIKLPIIESLYKFGKISKTDIVHISDGPNSPFHVYTLETLQSLYGTQYPFRRQNFEPIPRNCNLIDDFASSSSSSCLSSDIESEEEEKPQEKLKSKRKSVFLDEDKNIVVKFEKDLPASQKINILPLFSKEQTEDLIYGEEVRKSIIDLRKLAPLPWENKPEILEKFKDFERSSENVVKCELCDFTPFSAQLVIQHIFRDEHLEKLSTFGASKKSLKYWMDRFLAVNQTMALAIQRAEIFNKTIPLMFDPSDKSLGKRSPFSNGNKLKGLVEKIDENAFNKHGEFFSIFLETIGYPTICKMCNNLKLSRYPFAIISHIVSEEHLKKLKQHGYYTSDYSFWCQTLHNFGHLINKNEKKKKEMEKSVIVETKNVVEKEKLADKELAKRKAVALQKAREWQKIPLMFDPKNKNLPKRKAWKNGSALRKLVEKLDENSTNHQDSFFNWFFFGIRDHFVVGLPCPTCSEPLTKGYPYSIICHLVSDKHYSKLKEHGFYENEYSFWCQSIHDNRTHLFKKEQKSAKKNVSLPLLQKSENCDEFVDVKKREKLLDQLENRLSAVDKLEFNLSEKMKIAMKNSGGNAKCEFGCGDDLLIPLVPSTIVEHCLQQKHREALLSYGFCQEDFGFWSSELAVYKAKKYDYRQELGRNVPRIPLIDIGDTRPTTKHQREESIQKLNKLWDSVTAKDFNNSAVSLMQINKLGTCHACKLPPACFSNPVALASHVFSPEHKKFIIEYGIRNSDVKLWSGLLKNAKNRTSPQPQPPQPKVEQKPQVAAVSTSQEKKVEESNAKSKKEQRREKYAPNPPKREVPRVPLLDKPLENHELLKDETEILRTWMSMKNIVKNPIKRTCYIAIMDKHWFYCNICYKTPDEGYRLVMSGRLIHHIFSHQHLKNLKEFGISREDLQYWKELFDKTITSQKYPSSPIPFLYSNIDNQGFMRNRKLSENVIREKYAILREKIGSIREDEFNEIFKPLANRHDRDRCIWCDHPFKHNPSILAKHIGEEKHLENVIKYCLVSEDDFREWFDMFKFIEWVREEQQLELDMIFDEENFVPKPDPLYDEGENAVSAYVKMMKESKPVAVARPNVQTAIVKPQTPIATYTIKPPAQIQDEYYDLPLMRRNNQYRGRDFEWPPLAHLICVRKGLIRSTGFAGTKRKKCRVCDTSVDPSIIIEHVYSYSHMNNAFEQGYRFTSNDYDMWDSLMMEKRANSISVISHQAHWYDLQNVYIGMALHVYMENHVSLSNYIDETRFNRLAASLLKPAGCPVCMKWLLSPLEVAQHLVKLEHIQQMRLYRHDVKEKMMQPIFTLLMECQKQPQKFRFGWNNSIETIPPPVAAIRTIRPSSTFISPARGPPQQQNSEWTCSLM